jgi:hypothetical protein
MDMFPVFIYQAMFSYLHGGTQMTCTPVAGHEGQADGQGPTRLNLDLLYIIMFQTLM